MNIPLHYTARDYQVEALQALEAGAKLAVLCWSRRAGKDLTSFAYAIKKMVESPMNVALVFPTKEQGMKSFWNNTENDGFKTIEHIPKSLIASQDNTKMRIVLRNGSVFEVLGATDPDALRGANAKLYIFSEFVDIDSAAYEVIVPVVEVNGGQVILISTPKIDGISGGTFKVMFDGATRHMKAGGTREYSSIIRATEYLDAEALERLRQSAILKYGNDFFFRQEFLCDWGQVSSGSYFGGAVELCLLNGNIREEPYNPAFPAYTAWDLGTSDSTAIVMFQYYKKRPKIIEYFETSNIGYNPIASLVKSKPYNWGWHFFPHDGSVRESDLTTRIQRYRDLGLVNASLLRRESREDSIARAVEGIPGTVFNEGTTGDLIRKMKLYKRKFNSATGDYMGPEHKTESHANDALKYMYVAMEQMFDKKTGEFLYASAGLQDTYDLEEVATPVPWQYH
jgi:hypothetical protein